MNAIAAFGSFCWIAASWLRIVSTVKVVFCSIASSSSSSSSSSYVCTHSFLQLKHRASWRKRRHELTHTSEEVLMHSAMKNCSFVLVSKMRISTGKKLICVYLGTLRRETPPLEATDTREHRSCKYRPPFSENAMCRRNHQNVSQSTILGDESEAEYQRRVPHPRARRPRPPAAAASASAAGPPASPAAAAGAAGRARPTGARRVASQFCIFL